MEAWVHGRLVAGVMLAVYAAVAAIISGREVRFLAGVEPPRQRRLFILQDVAVQLGIIGVLLPCALTQHLNKQLLVVILSAFTLLWIAALWALVNRSVYTYRLMLSARGESNDLAELLRRATAEEQHDA